MKGFCLPLQDRGMRVQRQSLVCVCGCMSAPGGLDRGWPPQSERVWAPASVRRWQILPGGGAESRGRRPVGQMKGGRLPGREVTATEERAQAMAPTKRWVGTWRGGSRAGRLSAPRALGAFEGPECRERLARHPFKGLSPSTGTTCLSRPRCEVFSFDQPKVT